MTDKPAFTTLLDGVARGDAAAQDAVLDLVYGELKRIARGHIRRSGRALTINPSTLVHEAWIKFSAHRGELKDSAHFYNVLALAMRQILLDLAKQGSRAKHGAGLARTELTERSEQSEVAVDELLAIDSALDRLRDCDPELAQLVEWHFFAGLSFVEIAALRGANERTVRRHWDTARAFLLNAMQGDGVA